MRIIQHIKAFISGMMGKPRPPELYFRWDIVKTGDDFPEELERIQPKRKRKGKK